jgi:cytochrome c
MDVRTAWSASGTIGRRRRKRGPLPAPRIAADRRLATLAAVSAALSASFFGMHAGEAADIAKGKVAFVRQCAICHTIDRGGPNAFGPNLFGIVGKRAGTNPEFKYSNAFKTTATFEWSEGLLGPWVSLPAVMVPGTTMGIFPGVAERDRDDIVAYLASQK